MIKVVHRHMYSSQKRYLFLDGRSNIVFVEYFEKILLKYDTFFIYFGFTVLLILPFIFICTCFEFIFTIKKKRHDTNKIDSNIVYVIEAKCDSITVYIIPL
jgi:hypothetical protein